MRDLWKSPRMEFTFLDFDLQRSATLAIYTQALVC